MEQNFITNSLTLKQKIRSKSEKLGLTPGLVMQNYMIERLLERISVSKYKQNFVIKGGTLIASIMGLSKRATMDLDTTLKYLNFTLESVQKFLTEIISIDIGDGITFEIKIQKDIRVDDIYPGIKVTMDALLDKIRTPISIDITVGDAITPKEITYEYKLLFEDRKIEIMSYTLETVLSEKLHAIISFGEAGTRTRDYYDIYSLYNFHKDKIDFKILAEAVRATGKKKNTTDIFKLYKDQIEAVKNSAESERLWNSYVKKFPYAKDIDFHDVCDLIVDIMKKIN